MIKRLLLTIFLCFAAGAQEAGQTEPSAGRITGPFSFSISSDKANYEADEIITITSELRNTSDHDVTISMGSTLQIYSMDVRLPGPDGLPFRDQAVMSKDGLRMKYREGGVSHMGWVLKPGQALKDRFQLNKLYMMPLAGQYKVTFYFRAPDNVAKDAYVVSNELTLSISGKASATPQN